MNNNTDFFHGQYRFLKINRFEIDVIDFLYFSAFGYSFFFLAAVQPISFRLGIYFNRDRNIKFNKQTQILILRSA